MLTELILGSLAGVIRGIGQHRIFSVLCFVAFYPVNLTLMYFLVFRIGYRLPDYSSYGLGNHNLGAKSKTGLG